MVDVARVKMFGMIAGTFRWDEAYGVARFEYDGSFVGKGLEPSPLMMPVQSGRVYSFGNLNREVFNGLSGMLADSLPDTYGRARFLTKRFDRADGEKIHMQTLCGIAHYDFHLRRAYSYEQAFNVMRRLHLPYSQAEEMFLRMVFNVVIRNQNDHTKNISFLMDKSGKWRLSPAYDLGFAYNPEGVWADTHQMSVNGKFDDIARKDLMACAASNNIKNAAEIIDRVCEVASQWPVTAKNCGVPAEMINSRSSTCC